MRRTVVSSGAAQGYEPEPGSITTGVTQGDCYGINQANLNCQVWGDSCVEWRLIGRITKHICRGNREFLSCLGYSPSNERTFQKRHRIKAKMLDSEQNSSRLPPQVADFKIKLDDEYDYAGRIYYKAGADPSATTSPSKGLRPMTQRTSE